MSKVVIAWKIWTKGQIEATEVKLKKVRNPNKAVCKNSYQTYFHKKKCYRGDAPKWNIFLIGKYKTGSGVNQIKANISVALIFIVLYQQDLICC